jgi:tetratricopeptide (TPR) repeat protein
MRTSSISVAVVSLVMAVANASAHAADTKSWVGQFAMARCAEAKLQDGQKVIGAVPAGEMLRVSQQRGDWLQVDRGWVHKSELVTSAQAVGHFSDEIKRKPTAFAYQSRGRAWAERQEYDKALADFEAALKLDPNAPSAYANRGSLRIRLAQYGAAIADLSEAIRLDPHHVRTYVVRARAYSAIGDHDRAIADYDSAIRSDANNAPAHNSRGLMWAAKGEHTKAIADFDAAIRLDPQAKMARYNVYYNRANAWYDLGDNDRAIADYGRAIELDRHYAPAFLERGNAWIRKGDLKKASADFDEALRIDPNLQLPEA